MARYFIPNSSANSDPAKRIPRELWPALDEAIPIDAVVCVGLNINKRDVDIAIFTKSKVHVIESKNYTRYPVTFVPNQGLCEVIDGAYKPINNTRLRNGVVEEENAVKQAEKEMGAVGYSLRMLGYSCDIYPYISVPHPVIGSDVRKAGIFVWIKLGISNLMYAIQEREAMSSRPLRGGLSDKYPPLVSFPPHSEAERVNIAKKEFYLEQTTLDHVMAISKPGNILSQAISDDGNQNNQFPRSRAIQLNHFEKQKPLVKIGMLMFFAGILSFIVSGLIFPFQSLHFSRYLMLVGVTGFTLVLIGRVTRWTSLAELRGVIANSLNMIVPTKSQPVTMEYPPTSTPTDIAGVPQSPVAPAINNLPPPLPLGLSAQPPARKKSILRPAVIVTIAVGVVALILIISSLGSQRGCSTVNGLRIRNAPDGTEIGHIDNGVCVSVNRISSDGKWLQISSGKFTGDWVSIGFMDGVDVGKLKGYRD